MMIAYTLTLLVGILVTVLLYEELKSGNKKVSKTRQINSRISRGTKISISEKERELH